MSRVRAPLLLFVLLALGACQTRASPSPEGRRPSAQVAEPEEWRSVASESDAAALDGLAAIWTESLNESRRRYGRAIAGEGALLDPDGGEARAAPAPGPYRCRALRIGARTPAARGWAVSRRGFCYVGVRGDQLSFTSELPGTRVGGYLWDAEGHERLVFLGAAIPARARSAPPYGESPALNRIGLIERIGEFRYRLVMPTAEGDARLVVIELIASPTP